MEYKTNRFRDDFSIQLYGMCNITMPKVPRSQLFENNTFYKFSSRYVSFFLKQNIWSKTKWNVKVFVSSIKNQPLQGQYYNRLLLHGHCMPTSHKDDACKLKLTVSRQKSSIVQTFISSHLSLWCIFLFIEHVDEKTSFT